MKLVMGSLIVHLWGISRIIITAIIGLLVTAIPGHMGIACRWWGWVADSRCPAPSWSWYTWPRGGCYTWSRSAAWFISEINKNVENKVTKQKFLNLIYNFKALTKTSKLLFVGVYFKTWGGKMRGLKVYTSILLHIPLDVYAFGYNAITAKLKHKFY